MATEAAAPAAPAAQADAAPTDVLESHAQRIEARKESAGAEGKAGATNGSPSGSAAPTDPASKPAARPRAADIGALAQREWRVREKEQAAAAAVAKYQPLDQALEKKDLRAALTVMAEKHGVSFADFVTVLTEAEPPAKTATETAEEVVARLLAERDAADLRARQEQSVADGKAREESIRTALQELAEKGAEGAPDRWELTAIAGKAGEAWDVIWGHYVATTKTDAQGKVVEDGERLTKEQALDLIEEKLKQKREARRPKQETATGGGAGNSRNEAAGNGTDGRAAAPSFTNRATSGMPAAVGAQAIDEAGLPEHEAIARAASRVGIRL